jgi:hypothetical protein
MQIKHFLLLSIAICVLSCGPTTNVTNSWTSKDAASKPLEKVMILAMMPEQERTLREQLEQQLSTNLATEGYMSTSAYAEYGPKAFEKLSETQALKKLRTNNIDGVLIVTLLDKEKEERYTPGSVSYYPVNTRYNRFWGYYTTYYSRVFTPGYYTKNTRYFIETNLYDMKGNKLIYSAQSETVDMESAQKLATDYARAIVKNMQEHSLLLKHHKEEKK